MEHAAIPERRNGTEERRNTVDTMSVLIVSNTLPLWGILYHIYISYLSNCFKYHQKTHSINCILFRSSSVPFLWNCCMLLPLPISHEIMDGFWCSRCLNDRIKVPDMMRLFASGATNPQWWKFELNNPGWKLKICMTLIAILHYLEAQFGCGYFIIFFVL